MYTFSVLLLIRVAPNMFDTRFFTVIAENERSARLEALTGFLEEGGDESTLARVKVQQISEAVRSSKVPTLVGLQPVP